MKLLNINKLTEFLISATHPKRSKKSPAPAERSRRRPPYREDVIAE